MPGGGNYKKIKKATLSKSKKPKNGFKVTKKKIDYKNK